MRNRLSWIHVILMTILLAGIGVPLSHTQVIAAVDCTQVTNTSTADTDGDGFTDYQECYGITLAGGTPFPGSTSNLDRAVRLDPDTQDLFVVLVKTTPSNFPLTPLQFVSNPKTSGGLQIAVHEISASQTSGDRLVTTTQKAVRITESLDTSGVNPLGFSNTGTPNGLDLATIYTQRIINFIKTTCGSVYGTTSCVDSTGLYDNVATGNLALTKKYILHTINHEAGHVLGPLAPTYNSNYGGYHNKTGTNAMMDQSVYYTSKGGKVTFYIGTAYTSTDQSSAKLK